MSERRVTFTREQIADYAEASGDQNPIHLDDDFARSVGLPGVIAHGMLQMGIAATIASEAAGGPGRLRRMSVRFAGMVVPGDTVTFSAQPAGEGRLDVSAVNQRGVKMFDLTGKVAVVTGASRGLGRQDALTLASMGADVVITDVLVEDDPNLQQTAESQGSMLAQFAVSQGWVHSNATAEAIRQMGRKSLAIKMDVTNRDQVREVFKNIKDEFGKIDILINNAATLDHAAQIPNQSYELWDRDVKVNLTGAFNCTKEAWPYMVENHWGRLIFMSSVAGTLGGFGQASYSSTKAGLIGLAKTAALEGGRHNITANAIAPGIIESEAGKAAAANNPLYERFKARTVFKRFGQPEDIANTIAFLCTEEAGYITGAVIEVAGGIPLFTA